MPSLETHQNYIAHNALHKLGRL